MGGICRGYPIVLTADRTLMSEYGGGIFLGFSSVVPQGLIPDFIYYRAFCPPIDVNDDGSVDVCPCGTRKIEATLLGNGFRREDVIVAHPDHLEKVIGPDTRIVGITENDPLGIGPATSTFCSIFGGEAHMSIKFRELLRNPCILKYRPKVVVGGPGAWQLMDASIRRGLNIDVVLCGEGELVVAELFRRLIRGETVPGLQMGEVTPSKDIAKTKGAAVDGIVEISRGCGRGCDFCIPTMAKYRCRTVEDILEDVRTNLRYGRQPLLHAEDVIRYGASGFEVNQERLVGLFRSVRSIPGVNRISISHFALSSMASAPKAVEEISHIMELSDNNWLGAQTGLETGSPYLMRRHMIGKCRPYTPEQWRETVVDGFGLCQDNNWIPCSTLIIGLPGETDHDTQMTQDLVSMVSDVRSLIVPLFFVAMGGIANGERSFTAQDMTRKQGELFLDCWEHNLEWAQQIMGSWSGRSVRNPLERATIKAVLRLGIVEAKEFIRICRRDYDCDLYAFMSDMQPMRIVDWFPITARALANMNA